MGNEPKKYVGVRKKALMLNENDANWSTYFVDAKEIGDSIEFIYTQISNFKKLGLNSEPDERVFKIVFSCKDGKWHKSERIYGKIIPATSEQFVFE